ncbi:potassium-transporting ATPase subunit C [Nitratireductor indicus]|uniref:Potassium-transporting ATPase KdpC subunit n=1 Tax=Nitratireductor indicus C115 TaxID=1231190 RepID=K2PQ98_9HYPH|nr:potassium-transporting ATPase subunit C [Nitratireductor indicus]EKF43217.1 potassium-transporting ATPase [Nitratireductor indicus C115]MDS1137769.1 potassium-transporting ATPase subunit C [Nitratireductor indicus]SFQ53771.1 K+-transporting ATPase ATPase C chain [Nitratireductor indicus]
MQSLLASIRIAAATMLICVAFYATAVWAVAQAISPDTANGSLITSKDGAIIGSRQVAQAFTRPEYFWPRPSAVDYDGAGAGGSNLSPTSSKVTDRGKEIVERYGATPANPLPADLAAASGAGLDPHISEAAAVYQAARVAEARGMDKARLESLIRRAAFSPGGFLTKERIVNVLELNLVLDRL